MNHRPPSAKLMAVRNKENLCRSETIRNEDFAAVPTSRATLLQLINHSNQTMSRGDLQCRRLCGWQEDILQRMGSNKNYKRRGYSKRPQRDTQDDYQRNLYQLKKEAEFLESDEEEPAIHTNSMHKKIKFPTESDITDLLAKETRYLTTKNSMTELDEGKEPQGQNEFKKTALDNSGQFAKKIVPSRNQIHQGLQLRLKQRSTTSVALSNQDPLLVKSMQVCKRQLQENYKPIHTALKLRRHRRKVRSVTQAAAALGKEDATAGLVGNAAILRRSEYVSINSSTIPSGGVLMFRKYNQAVRGKKLRTHRITTADT